MTETVLVTGGAGYLGTILVPELLKRDYAVTVVDTFASGDTALVGACQYERFEPIKGDARNMELLAPLAKKADIIIPLAALVGAPLCDQDPITAQTLNQDAVEALVKLVGKDQRVVFPTTNSGYGVGEKDVFCTEETPLNPISLYGRTKCAAEKAVLDSGNGVTLRLATVFGLSPAMRIDLLVNDFTYRAVTDRTTVLFEGHFKRNYIHVRDVAKAFIHAVENYDQMNNEAYNVGLSDANLSKVELCQRIKRYVPNFTFLEAPIGEDPDKRDYIVSNEKIEKTGFQPDWSLDRGVQELIKGYRMLKNRRYSKV